MHCSEDLGFEVGLSTELSGRKFSVVPQSTPGPYKGTRNAMNT